MREPAVRASLSKGGVRVGGGLELGIVLFDFVCIMVFAHTNLILLVVVV